ncbi:hypothetical protein [Aquipuribacter sp. SD81]|uniref:hypothetical protein n=1 Tax=Aquipuribacter sp. SD81 TaxID=3127703 RepID=UPI00301A7312
MSEHPRRRPARVRVTRSVPLRGRVPSPAQSPEVVSVYDRDLRRTQLRWSVLSLLVVVLPLLLLPLVAVLAPGLVSLPVLGVPLAWLVLSVGTYPVFWLVGRWHVNGAERTEAEYVELVGEGTGDGPP